MDMEFTVAGRLAALAGNHAVGGFDWQGLRARLAAAYAAHDELERAILRPAPVSGGSFDDRSARLLAAYGDGLPSALGGVNRTALANGKSTCDTCADVAGASAAGD
jgi:hypothetical protein